MNEKTFEFEFEGWRYMVDPHRGELHVWVADEKGGHWDRRNRAIGAVDIAAYRALAEKQAKTKSEPQEAITAKPINDRLTEIYSLVGKVVDGYLYALDCPLTPDQLETIANAIRAGQEAEG